MSDQLAAFTQRIKTLAPRHALVRLPDNSVHEITTNEVADPAIDTGALESQMRATYFRSAEIPLLHVETSSPPIKRGV